MLRDWGEAPKTAEPAPETIEVQVPPSAVPGTTLEFELDDGRTIDVTVPEGARAGDRFQVPLSLAAAAPPAESIEMQEELRADTRAAETGPTAAERSLPLWAEYIQNNDESSDDDSSYVPDYNSDGETIIDETSDSDSNIEMQEELGTDTAEPEGECTAECAYNHAIVLTVLFWLLGTIMTFVAGFEFTYTFEAAFNIHHLLPDKAYSTSAIICFVCLLLSVLFVFSLPFGPTWYAKCGGDRENFSGKYYSPFLSLIALLYCVAFGFAVHARNNLDDTVEDYCDLWDDEENVSYDYYYSFDCDKDVKENLFLYLDVLLSCTAINAALTAAVAYICCLPDCCSDSAGDKPVPSDGPSDAVDVESGADTRTSIEGEETVVDGEVVTSPASSENVVDAEPVSPSISFWAARPTEVD